ncbi:PE-PGRS family protein [Streptomyces sp. MST-110588]|uniref:PE-PGRS family protein n=1 Tax=Streptomyces sp. MST-110588 TaxID=2833628 RepID=UPI001F5C6AFC|nr:PE-PGRS family protein [Streptomyces sp. MST-110588]
MRSTRWLIAEGRVKEWRERTARQAAAPRTAQEQEADWARLFRGPGPGPRLRTLWADGLARNPATPEDVRHGLLGLSHFLLWRELPATVVDAAIAHPQWHVRDLLAEVQPAITPEQWSRLILAEQGPGRRWILVTHAADRGAQLTATAYERLTTDPDARVRAETARLPGLPAASLHALATDPEPAVRKSVGQVAWSQLAGPVRRELLADPDGEVRTEALLRHHRDHPLPRSVFDSEELGDRAARGCLLERELAAYLVHHPEPALRAALAGNPRLEADVVAALARDPDPSVRDEVAVRPDLTERQRADVLELGTTFRPGDRGPTLDWVHELHGDPGAMRRLAASAHPLVRRSVARARRLPPDVVELLARDQDRVVRLFLAESCDDAPADMLMEVWRWWTGSLSCPDRPRSHPNFPRHGLLRYAEDPDARMRRLALDDPESTAGLVERLSRDPHREVRWRAATDPRLSVASAVRLLDDPCDEVRHAAIGHPELPAGVLVTLLRDHQTAQEAARHPALPVEVIRKMAERLRA